MLIWQEFKWLWNRFKWSVDLKSTNISSTYYQKYDGLYSKGHLYSQFCSWWAKNSLASEGLNGDPIATPWIWLYNILLNIKCDSLVAKDRRSLNSLSFKPWTMSLFLNRLLVQISMVSWRGILIKCESISKLPMKFLESCSTVSVTKLNEYFSNN